MTRNQYSGIPFDEVLEEFCEDSHFSEMLQDTVERQKILADLRQIRVAKNLRQTDIAESMRTSQSAVSELEGEGDDVYLSTIQRYASAVGAELIITVVRCGPEKYNGYPRPATGASNENWKAEHDWVVTPDSDVAIAAAL